MKFIKDEIRRGVKWVLFQAAHNQFKRFEIDRLPDELKDLLPDNGKDNQQSEELREGNSKGA